MDHGSIPQWIVALGMNPLASKLAYWGLGSLWGAVGLSLFVFPVCIATAGTVEDRRQVQQGAKWLFLVMLVPGALLTAAAILHQIGTLIHGWLG
jgi:hypothetical protein